MRRWELPKVTGTFFRKHLFDVNYVCFMSHLLTWSRRGLRSIRSQPPGSISTCYGLTFSNQMSILSSQQRLTSRDQSQPPGQNHQAPAPNHPHLRAPNPCWDHAPLDPSVPPVPPFPSLPPVPSVPPVLSVPPVRGPAAPSWPVEFCCQAFDLLKNLIIRHRE